MFVDITQNEMQSIESYYGSTCIFIVALALTHHVGEDPRLSSTLTKNKDLLGKVLMMATCDQLLTDVC